MPSLIRCFSLNSLHINNNLVSKRVVHQQQMHFAYIADSVEQFC